MEGRESMCDGCRKMVPVSEIKYTQKGKDDVIALCSTCRGVKTTISRDIVKDLNILREKEAEKKSAPKKESVGKDVYFCGQCRYRFNYDPKSQTRLKCPYCGTSYNVVKHDFISAEALLNEVE